MTNERRERAWSMSTVGNIEIHCPVLEDKGMEDVCLIIEYNDDVHEASCASQHACKGISDGCSCHSRHNRCVDLCNSCQEQISQIQWIHIVCCAAGNGSCFSTGHGTGLWKEVVSTNVKFIELSPVETCLLWVRAFGEINRNRLATLGRSSCRSGRPLIRTGSFPCPSFLRGLGAFIGLLLPLLERLEPVRPQRVIMDTQCLNHRGVQVCHIGNPFAILFWTNHHLSMSLSWLGHRRHCNHPLEQESAENPSALPSWN